jgi:O-antigen/teichoic acid export membrane protein
MAGPGFDHVAMVAALGVICTVSVSYMVYQGSSLAVLDAERTGRLAWSAAASLAVLVVLALWLAPGHGIVGVAVAKALGYAVLMALTTWFARGHSPLRWPPRLWVVASAAVVVALAGAAAPVSGGALWLRLVAAAAVAVVGLLLAPRILRTLRG